MKKVQLFDNLISTKSSTSSSRAINLLGAVISSFVVVYQCVILHTINYEIFGLYLAYCGGVYGVGKYLERKQDDSTSTEPTEGCKDSSSSSVGDAMCSTTDK